MPVSKLEAILAASAARTATGTGTLTVDTSAFKAAAFYLDVTVASGTSPTLVVDIETFDPASANWQTLDSFAQKTAAGKERKAVTANLGSRIRVKWTIGGTTPSFTFSVGVVAEDS